MSSYRNVASLATKNIVAILLSIVTLLPFLVVVLNSFATQAGADAMQLHIPKVPQWSNYAVVIQQGGLVNAFVQSMLLSCFSVAVATVLAAMASFVLSRNGSRTNRVIYYLVVTGIALPVNYVALMKIMQLLHLVNTTFGVGLLYAAVQIPFDVFLVYGFVSSIPAELDEAAFIDGANALTLFFRVIFPLLKPVLTTIVLLSFIGAWNDFVTPLYYLNSAKKWPMTLAVYNFFGQYQSSWNLVCADVVLTTLPVIALYLAGQRHIVAGMTAGAVKG